VTEHESCAMGFGYEELHPGDRARITQIVIQLEWAMSMIRGVRFS
jgi:hypothetical protein